MLEKKAQEELREIGKVAAQNYLAMNQEELAETEKVASFAGDVSEADMEIVKQAEMVGEGMAMGYNMGLQDSIKVAADNIYSATFATIAKVAEDKEFMAKLAKLNGDNYAIALQEKVAEFAGENPEMEEEIKAEIAKGVAPIVIEAVGGEEALAQMAEENPEAVEQLAQTVEAITEQAKEEVLAAAAEGMPEEGMPEEGMPQEGMPQEGMPAGGMPQQQAQ